MDTCKSICKAIIQEGPRKGLRCQFPPLENDNYCGRHERNKIYDAGILENKIWCRLFFRGCDNTTTKINTSCKSCKDKKHEGKKLCNHEGCPHHVEIEGFCKKHERDKYYIEEKEKGIKYCDISRGCFEQLKCSKK